MSGAREGYNLWTRMGRRHLRKNWRWNGMRYVGKDTFAWMACKVLGHKPYDCNEGGTPEWACRRCGQFLRGLSTKGGW